MFRAGGRWWGRVASGRISRSRCRGVVLPVRPPVFQRPCLPWLVLALLPLLLPAPLALFGLSVDPLLFTAELNPLPHGLLPTLPGWNDPNAGYTAQALGGYAARQWLHGSVPWWNPYAGVGLPLAAEMQPAALFLPFSLLLAAPCGVLLLKLAVQAIAGWACFALLRQLGLAPRVALLGGVLFELCGSFAWCSHAPIYPIPFLPLLLLGIERSAAHATERRRGGWAWAAVATAYSLVAGFPETALIDGLFAAAWAALRLASVPGAARLALARKLATAAAAGLLLAAPAVLPFLHYLPLAETGQHASYGTAALDPGTYALLLVPYFYGPLDYRPQWASAGGYLGLPLLLLGLLALRRGGRQAALRWLLAGWIVLAIAKGAQVPGVAEAFNLVPFLSQAAFARYAPPSWELAAVVLACCTLDDWQRGAGFRAALLPALVATGALLAVAIALARPALVEFRAVAHHGLLFVAASVGWGGGVAALAAALLARRCSPGRGAALGALLAGNAALLFALPLLGAAPAAPPDAALLAFLHRNQGLARFYTLGPFQPNYGAAFGLASINHNALPIDRDWVEYVRAHLDPDMDGVDFTGVYPPSPPGRVTRAAALRAHLPAFAAIGVKYVLARPGHDPFAGAAAAPPLVFADDVAEVYELPDPAPYFAVAGAHCLLMPDGREHVLADCPGLATLRRLELFYPGWTASIGGAPAEIAPDGDIFQSVALPAGRSDLKFRYAPPGLPWALAAFAVGAAVLLAGLRRR